METQNYLLCLADDFKHICSFDNTTCESAAIVGGLNRLHADSPQTFIERA